MVLAFGLALFFLFGCQSLERDNVYDPDGNNYVGGGGGDSSSSGGAPVSSITSPSSSSSGRSSSNTASPSSSPAAQSSSSVAVVIGCGSDETHYCSDGEKKPYGELTDSRDGKKYKTVVIGEQEWMAENLNYDGDISSRYTVGKCIPIYGDILASFECLNDKYGRLYDWSTAMNLAKEDGFNSNRYGTVRCGTNCWEPVLPHRGVCPQGWHLPTDAEWTTLMEAVVEAYAAGSKLKATSGWNEDGNGTNDYGFSALPGGYGYSSGSFYNVGHEGDWWSSTELDASNAYRRSMHLNIGDVVRVSINKSNLYSVRCLRDN
ncbi:MAG: hypothetical protein FWB90_09570 [Fibromonadales bacterium]|nr:hypothetical protein [Fibromonadales bacterium]